ncbi:M61 family metallopeptidase [Longimicrobium terrae]|uniref:Putative metalloprotease with PDZ domain n=1 Tax=Longimicrobium terrae TaxID=1639882 RepID=A0A841GY13_9BACT|nr:PDZ domain-containing protein [Longimicrobium terrae]MBB4636256.1 putative metalloprotease with PDZ domain [Longimicrobium terrae]MBB6070651.1 putative metalloprotease with PDZ domain [Longimicrobium terrae]NNC29635.1 M61 family metallopeptidase [Longimicrobium terrae]
MRHLLPLPALAAALLIAAPASAQERVEYDIRFPNRVHHEAEVTATFTGVPAGHPLEVRMSRTSPGRYALHEFAKNVYGVRVTDGRGRALQAERSDPSGWTVAGHDGTVRVQYTLFGDRVDGTYTAVDATHAHLNMPATFMWARGMERAPIRVRFDRPDGWRVATQLAPTPDSAVFTAPNLQWFMDSPAEVSDFDLRTWTVAGPGGRTYTMRMAMHHLGTDAELDRYVEKTKKVVAEEIAMWGEPAAYDNGTYTFLADYLPWASGDGMEHRNSTVITAPASLAQAEMGLLGTVSHEYFHSWNVERLRPRSLEPFNFTEANMSGELWFAEGFTSYYDALFIRRAGLSDDAEYASEAGGTANAVVNAAGRRFFSPVEMAKQAPFVDAAVSIDPVNRGNTFLSYYTWGAGIGLGLDLTLRSRFNNITLDDFMRAMWRQYGREQTPALAPARPYTVADLRRVLGEVTRDTAFANDFFRRYVEGREAVDYAPLLARAGYLLRKSQAGRPWLGGQIDDAQGGGVRLTQPSLYGGSLYSAGLDIGDVIRSVDGQLVANAAALRTLLQGRQAGDRLQVEVVSRGTTRTVAMALVENPALEAVPYEAAGMTLTPEMRAFRESWLGSRAGR